MWKKLKGAVGVQKNLLIQLNRRLGRKWRMSV
jgi:hypothetical protein